MVFYASAKAKRTMCIVTTTFKWELHLKAQGRHVIGLEEPVIKGA